MFSGKESSKVFKTYLAAVIIDFCVCQLEWDPREWGRMSDLSTVTPKETKSLIKEEHYQPADGLELREAGSRGKRLLKFIHVYLKSG